MYVLDEIKYGIIVLQCEGLGIYLVKFFFVLIVIDIFGDIYYWDIFDFKFVYDFSYSIYLSGIVVNEQQVWLVIVFLVRVFFQEVFEVVGQYFFYYVKVIVWCEVIVFDIEFVIVVFCKFIGSGYDYCFNCICILNM